MANKLYGLFIKGIIMLLFIVLNGSIHGQEKEQEHSKNPLKIDENIFAEIASICNQTDSVLEFKIRNNSKNFICTMPLSGGGNTTIIENPKGEMLEDGMSKDWFYIKPSATYSWGYNVSGYFGMEYSKFFEDAGVYRLYWHLNMCIDWEKNKDVAAYKDCLIGPISFLKEKKTKAAGKNPGYEKSIKESTEKLNKIIKKNDKPVLLDVFHILGRPATLLECRLENNTKEEIQATPICENNSRIVIVTPAGKEQECYVSKNYEKPPVVLKPFEKKSWRLDIVDIGKQYNVSFNKPGIYKVYWKFSDDKGNIKEEIKSGPILLLKNE